ncbi:MAG: glutamate-5-semialdehyde dehydrogenase [Ruminococcaceae bacterium]|nr:glutamate-5-semialdehyde dehydrogenase [Oscillospiraceae bacterium]
MTTKEILKKAKKVAPIVAKTSDKKRKEALLSMADMLVAKADYILTKNAEDVKAAREKLGSVMIDRLTLTKERIHDMAKGLRVVAELPDPLKRKYSKFTHNKGMTIQKVAVPIGVVAIIYESRPNVTSDAASLAIRAGNACILRSGKDAFESAFAIVEVLKEGLAKVNFPTDSIQLIEDKTRESATELMKANGYVDLLIPRGGAGLINTCIENATVPCIQTGTGICHVYIDKYADIDKALKIINNAKTSRPSVCNAAEVCLVHKDVANDFLPKMKALLTDERTKQNLVAVELRGDKKTCEIIDCTPATKSDFDTEFLDYILAVKIVSSESEAIKHIAKHSTGHSEAIISENARSCNSFIKGIDSAAVYVNTSTRFTDGGEFGLGCEMGISTQKLHARGPMGLEELTTYKYVIKGNGQIR